MSASQKKFFLDTNILVYTFDRTDSSKRLKANGLLADALETHRGIISYQVVQEFLNVATRKFSDPMTVPEAQLYLARILMPLCEVFPDSALYSQALSIAGESGMAFYDALIISSAIAGGCEIVWTEDLQHGRQIGTVTIRNPFAA
jgi:predicted nucleic acid-binding protein